MYTVTMNHGQWLYSFKQSSTYVSTTTETGLVSGNSACYYDFVCITVAANNEDTGWPLYRDCGGKAGQNSDPRRPLQFLVYSVLLLNYFWRLIFTWIPSVHRAPNLDNRPEIVRNWSVVPHYAQNYVTTAATTFSSVGHFWTYKLHRDDL